MMAVEPNPFQMIKRLRAMAGPDRPAPPLEVDRLLVAREITPAQHAVALEILRCRRALIGHETVRSPLRHQHEQRPPSPERAAETERRGAIIRDTMRRLTLMEVRILERAIVDQARIPDLDMVYLRSALDVIGDMLGR